MISEWQSSIANADAADWVNVAVNLFAAVMSIWAAKQARIRLAPREELFWRFTAGILVFWAVNELLDLQTLLTAIGRQNAIQNGWYGEHREVQYWFIIGLSVVAAIAGILMLWLTRRTHITVRLAIVGLAMIGLFVLFRAASFHHFDEYLGRGHPVFNWGAMEFLGTMLVASAAAVYASLNQTRAKQ